MLLGKLFKEKEPAFTLERSMADLKVKSAANLAVLHIGDTERWDADLDKGTIVFSSPDRVVTGRVQVVGSYNTNDRSWLWGWANASVDIGLAQDALLAREFGERHRLSDYTNRKIYCTEEQAWQFAAVACYLAKATGAYRGPSESAHVFMTFHDVTIRAPDA